MGGRTKGNRFKKNNSEKLENEKLSRINKVLFFLAILATISYIVLLVTNIADKKIDAIILYVILGISNLVILKLTFNNFAENHIIKGNIFLEFIKILLSFVLFIIAIVILVLVGIMLFAALSLLREMIFINYDYILYMVKSPYMIALIIAVGIIIAVIILKYLRFKISKKAIISIIILFGISVYLGVTNITVVTESGIYDYSFYNIGGTRLGYNNVISVETGFETTGEYKGEFYYEIELKNGEKLNITESSISEEYEDDILGRYVYIDSRIMNYDITKNSSEAGVEYSDMSQEDIENLLKIIRNR